SSRPVVVTVHDLQPFDHPEHFSVLKEGFLSWSVPRSLRRADVVVTVSGAVGEQVVRHFGVDPGRVVTVSSGVDRVADRPVEPSSPPVVIYPAVSHPHKNHGLLIEAFSRIADLHPEARLVLTGGSGRSEGAVILSIERSGLGDRIERTGRIPDAEYAQRLADASLMAFPSLYEGFGIPVLEAMAVGVPIIVASGTPADDVAGGAGWSVDPDDVTGWAEALDRALGDAGARRVAAEAGLRRAAEFSWEASAEQLERAWRLALDTPG
ncbi:MAG: glycosyltransferase family 1 protein, partial [Acidimicrobiales bacterium]|nr:glycosyltransferase family 1 protein [Acidimicrobiales bacterium]